MLISNPLFMIFISLYYSINANEIETFKECLIHNLQYSREYLYTSDDPNWPNQKNMYVKRNMFTYPLSKVNDYEKITWILIPAKSPFQINRTNYLIKSGKYENEYVCAINEHEIFSKNRRIIMRMKLISHMIKTHLNCHWTIETKYSPKLNRTTHTFKNVLFDDEHVYAASPFFSVGWYKRSVYLWSERTDLKLSSNKFKWMIDCSRGDYLISK